MADGDIRFGLTPETTSEGTKTLDNLSKQLDELEQKFESIRFSPDTDKARAELEKLSTPARKIRDDLKDVPVDLNSKPARKQLRELRGLAEDAFSLGALLAAVPVVTGFADSIGTANDALQALQGQTGATGDELDRLKDAATEVFSAGVGETFGDAVRAIGAANQQLGELLSPSEITEFTKTAGGIAEVFDDDVNNVLAKSRTFIQNFGLEGAEAANLVSGAMQGAANAQQDVLDTLDEYSPLAADAGFSAQQFTSILIDGVQKGARNTDKLGDAIKEASIRLSAGDISQALSDIQSPVTATIQGIVAAGEQGNKTLAEVLKESVSAVQTAFERGEISSAVRSQLQVAISGTPAEDIGTDLYGRIFSADIPESATNALGAQARQQIEGAIGPTNVISQVLADVQGFGTALAAEFEPAISGGAKLFELTAQLAPGVVVMHDAFGALNETLGPLVKNIVARLVPGLGAQLTGTTAVTGATIAQTAATQTQTAATITATGALRALFATLLSNPLTLVVAGVAALGTALFFLLDAGESVEEAMEGVNDKLESTDQAIADTSAVDAQANALLDLADRYDELAARQEAAQQSADVGLEGTVQLEVEFETGKSPEEARRLAAEEKELIQVTNQLAAAVPGAVRNLKELEDGTGQATGQIEIATDSVRRFAEEQLRLNEEIRRGELADLADETQELVDATEDAQEKLERLRNEEERLRSQEVKFQRLAAEGHRFHQQQLEAVQQNLENNAISAGKVAAEVQKGSKGIVEATRRFVEQGDSVEEIADKLETSEENAALYVQQVRAADQATRDTEEAQAALAGRTAKQVDLTADLAKKWDTVSDAIGKSVDQQLKAIAFQILQIRDADREGLGGGLFESLRKIQLTKAKLEIRDTIERMQELDAILKELKIEFGLEETEEKTEDAARGIQTILVDLTDQYQSAAREISDINADLEIDTIQSPFAGLVERAEEDERRIRRELQDQREAVSDELDRALKEVDKKRKEAARAGDDPSRIRFQLELEVDGERIVADSEEEARAAVDRVQKKITELETLRTRQREEQLKEEQLKLVRERIATREQLETEALELEQERLEFRVDALEEFADASISGLERLRDARIALLNEEQDAAIRSAVESTAGFEEGNLAIEEAYRERLAIVGRQLKEGEITEAEANERIVAAEAAALETRADLRRNVYEAEIEDSTSRVSLIEQRFAQRTVEIHRDIADRIRELVPEAYDAIAAGLDQLTDSLIQTWERYFDSLSELREEDSEEEKQRRKEEVADLKKQLRRGEIFYEDYVDSLRSLREQDKESSEEATQEQRTFLEQLGATLRETGIEQAKTRGDSIATLDDILASTEEKQAAFDALSDEEQKRLQETGEAYNRSADVQEQALNAAEKAAVTATGGIITSLAGLVTEGELSTRNFAISVIDAIAGMLDSVVPALVALIFGESVAANPLLGTVIAAGLTATLLGLAAAAKSALQEGQSSLGSRREGGYTGDAPVDAVAGVYHGREFVHDADTTRQYRDLFETIHRGGDPVEWIVDHAGRLTVRQRKSVAEKLVPEVIDVQQLLARQALLKSSDADVITQMIQTGNPAVIAVEAYHDEIVAMLARERAVIPVRGHLNANVSAIDQQMPRFNEAAIVSAVERQTGRLEGKIEDLQNDFSDVKRTFRDSRAVQLSGKFRQRGADLEAVIDHQQTGRLSV